MTWYRRSIQLCFKARENFKKRVRYETFIRYSLNTATGLAVATTVYATTHLETIPFSSRTHLILKPSLLENNLLRFAYWVEKKCWNLQELHSSHPATLKLKPIAERLIEAANKRLDEKSREGFDWEVVVIDKDDGCVVDSFSGGLIVLDSGLAHESDDEIAARIANAVARLLGRHRIEFYGNCAAFVGLFHLLLPAGRISNIFPVFAAGWLPLNALNRELDKEEKYIGMMVMASAGYDPSVAITMARRFPRLTASFHLSSCWASQRETVGILCEAQDEAMVLYKEALSSP